MAIITAIPSNADNSNGDSPATPINIKTLPIGNGNDPIPNRAPAHINIDVYYDYQTQTLNIEYCGEASGEVFLYLNDNVIGYDNEINTSFSLSTSGLYKIEIITESWVAEGYFEL